MNDRILFSTTTKLLSRIIRWFTQAPVSHCSFLYFDVDFGREMVLEATLEGVRIIPLEVFQKHNIVVKTFIPRHDLKPGLAKAGSILGAAYDFTGLLGMLWVLLGRWFKKKWQNPLDNVHSLFCSEFVARVLWWSSYPGTEYWEPRNMTPADLYGFFQAQEAKEARLNRHLDKV
jgi:hypothetical protein